MYSSTLSLTSALDGVGGQLDVPAALPPGKTRYPRSGLDGCGKSRPPPGFDPRTLQPMASRYTGPWKASVTLKILRPVSDCNTPSEIREYFPVPSFAR